MERTLILLKPDAVQRQLVGRILQRFEAKGLKLVALKMLVLSRAQARKMYAEHEGKDFHEPLITFVTAGPSVALVLEGAQAITVARSLIGPTFGPDAPAGTIRGDLGLSMRYNLVHGSDCREAAEREIAVLFEPAELLDYRLDGENWIYAESGGELI